MLLSCTGAGAVEALIDRDQWTHLVGGNKYHYHQQSWFSPRTKPPPLILLENLIQVWSLAVWTNHNNPNANETILRRWLNPALQWHYGSTIFSAIENITFTNSDLYKPTVCNQWQCFHPWCFYLWLAAWHQSKHQNRCQVRLMEPYSACLHTGQQTPWRTQRTVLYVAIHKMLRWAKFVWLHWGGPA